MKVYTLTKYCYSGETQTMFSIYKEYEDAKKEAVYLKENDEEQGITWYDYEVETWDVK